MENKESKIRNFSRSELEKILAQRKQVQSLDSDLTITKVTNKPKQVPLSFSQRRLWFLDQYISNSAAYNIPVVLKLVGEVDLNALKTALSQLVERHDSLHSIVVNHDGEGYQKVLESYQFDCQVSEATSHWEEEIRHEVFRPFKLNEEIPIRARLISFPDATAILCITIHHIAADGWSLGILLKDLNELYENQLSENPKQLAPLAIQYADYALWQQEFSKTATFSKQEAYWQDTLKDCDKLLHLPTDFTRPQEKQYTGATYLLKVPQALKQQMQAFFKSKGVTDFTGMMAVYQLLLAKLTQQNSFAVGFPIANRHQLAVQSLIGYFSNTLVLNATVDQSHNFLSLLALVKERMLSATQHQDMPFERLAQTLVTTRDTAYTPLFQAAFFFQNAPLPDFKLGDCQVKYINYHNGSSKFDLTLQATHLNDEMELEFEYDNALFHESTIALWADSYLHLLKAVITQPQKPLRWIELCTDELRQKFNKWNETELHSSFTGTIYSKVYQQSLKKPTGTALVHRDQSLTYAELEKRVNQIAHALIQSKVQSGDRVAIYLDRSCELIAAILAVLKVGACYVPIDPEYPAKRIAYVLEDSAATTIITETKYRKNTRNYPCIISNEITPHGEVENIVPRAISPQSPAYIYYTSGSSGQPKGVVVSHANVHNFFLSMNEVLSVDEQSVWHSVTGISFDISILELFWTLSNGLKVVIQDALLLSKRTSNQVKPMGFSLFFFSSKFDQHDSYQFIQNCAAFADQSGFEAIWTPERHFNKFGGQFPNPVLTSAMLAATTQQLQIRAGSVVVPLHSPIRIAEDWAVLDHMSKGRVGLSLASGWHPDDFVIAPENFEQRHQILKNSVKELRSLWQGQEKQYLNGKGIEKSIQIYPTPLRNDIPMWLTAASNPKTFQMAGQLGCHLLTHLLGQSPQELSEKIKLYRDELALHHPEKEGKVTLMLHTYVGADPDEVKDKVYEPFCQYLLHSYELITKLAPDLALDADNLTDDDQQELLDYAFNRYVSTSSLIGTPEHCSKQIELFSGMGVDEVACLVDFGLSDENVLQGLNYLNQVKNEWDEELNAAAYSFWQQAQKHQITHLQSTPTLLSLLLEEKGLTSIPSLKELLIGGEKLPFSLAEKVRFKTPPTCAIKNMYGPTETTIWSAHYPLTGEEVNTIPIGKPIANTQCYVVDENLMQVPIGTAGELLIGGEGVSTGYWKKPTLTAERFIPDPFSGKHGARLYRTGDRVKYLKDGSLVFLGRLDEQVKLRGRRIELNEIAHAIEQSESVDKAVVLLQQDEKDNAFFTAYVQPKASVRAWMENPSVKQQKTLRTYNLSNGLSVFNHNSYETRLLDREIFQDHIYLKHGLALHPHAVVFDVGANIGMFSLYCKTRFRSIQVHSFEPIPDTFEVLSANNDLYNLDLMLYPLALSDREDEVSFTYYPKISGLSGITSARGKDKAETQLILRDFLSTNKSNLTEQATDSTWESNLDEYFEAKHYQCQTRTLSEVIQTSEVEQIDLLKIDVEGSELAVLQGIQAQDWARIKQVVIETQGVQITQDVIQLLNQHGFETAQEELFHVKAVDQAQVLVCIIYASKTGLSKEITQLEPFTKPTFSQELVKTQLAETLPTWMIPSYWIALPDFPTTANGKIDKKQLPHPQIMANSSREIIPPETAIEKQLAAIYANTFTTAEISVDDDFFEIGGHSLLAVRIIFEIQKSFNVEITLGNFLKNPTISALAERIFEEQVKLLGSSEVLDLLAEIQDNH
ncbi:MAG: MupA/Atu3671 family FMN-dependent luciferase-like monooxygenase [Flammeovirgaceae bacterium]